MSLSFVLIMFLNFNFHGNCVFADDLQQVQVTGTIVDESGAALPGVNVVVKGTTIGTTTDIDGKYTLSVPDRNSILVASFIGYIIQEISVVDVPL